MNLKRRNSWPLDVFWSMLWMITWQRDKAERSPFRNKIRSDQKRLFFAVSLYPLSFFANTPFKLILFKSRQGWIQDLIKEVLDLFRKNKIPIYEQIDVPKAKTMIVDTITNSSFYIIWKLLDPSSILITLSRDDFRQFVIFRVYMLFYCIFYWVIKKIRNNEMFTTQ